MKHSLRFFRSIAVITPCLTTLVLAVGCSPDGEIGGSGGASSGGRASGGATHTGGAAPAGGSTGIGGRQGGGAGGAPSNGEAGRSGGATAGSGGTGAASGSGGGGRSFGGAGGKGSGTGGTSGKAGSGGGGGTGGKAASGGATSGGASGDACATTAALTGGTKVETSNKTGKAAGLDWALWSNGSGGSITTYAVPAFSATWANSGDFLARLGLQWNATKTYEQYGTITAQFNYKRTGTAGGYSYIGMYGWSVSPCVEWYIVDDSFNKMPVNPGTTTNKGTADIDGGKYTLYTRSTTGTGGSKCGSETSWLQFYSIRQTARQCGQISVTAHFDAWAAVGMTLGKLDQAQILLEVGGGTGTADFTVANVTASL
jgi:endo-1,4-beta-xylanase